MGPTQDSKEERAAINAEFQQLKSDMARLKGMSQALEARTDARGQAIRLLYRFRFLYFGFALILGNVVLLAGPAVLLIGSSLGSVYGWVSSRAYVAIPVIVALGQFGLVLYRWRTKYRKLYGQIEMGIAGVTIATLVFHPRPDAFTNTAGIVAALYVLVRGQDNVAAGAEDQVLQAITAPLRFFTRDIERGREQGREIEAMLDDVGLRLRALDERISSAGSRPGATTR